MSRQANPIGPIRSDGIARGPGTPNETGMTPGDLTEDFERLIAPIRQSEVEIGVLVYVGRDGHLKGVRHIRGHREGVELPIRAIVADALAIDACTAIAVHNHPSGNPKVSDADIAVTRRLYRTLDGVAVRLRDHIILTATARTSMRAEGYL